MLTFVNYLPAVLVPLLTVAILAAAIKLCVQDARRRGKSPWLVCLLTVVFFPVGTIAWLLLRPDPTNTPGAPRPFRLEDHRLQ